jgi:hypothetical protein
MKIPEREIHSSKLKVQRSKFGVWGSQPARVHERGMVLITTLVIACLVGIVVGAVLIVAQQQNSFSARSRTWSSEIPIAEAGIEEAMAHLNTMPSDLESNGWTKVSGKYVKTRTLGDGYFYASISPATLPTITSVGYGRIPGQTNYTQRTVVVTTSRANAGGFQVAAKGVIKMSGGAFIDSFDSSITNSSSNGVYTSSRRLDTAMVGSLSSAKPAIDSSGLGIYGSVATGVGGTVNATVGDGTWVGTKTGVQTGHASDDFNMAIPNVTVPFNPAAVSSIPAVNEMDQFVFPTGDYATGTGGKLTVPGGGAAIITGPGLVRIFVDSDFTISGSGYLKIMEGAQLELYLDGKGTISGGGVMNDSLKAVNCAIYGTTNCTVMTYSGSAAFIGQVYTPQAAFTFSGSAGASGSFVANTISLSGSAGVHTDQALSRPTGLYEVGSWSEL